MTDNSHDRTAVCSLLLLAELPAGQLMDLATALEEQDRRTQRSSRAVEIQRDQIVVSLFQSYLANGNPAIERIRPETASKLVALRACDIGLFEPSPMRSEFLLDQADDMAREYQIATTMQRNNDVPANVLPIGQIFQDLCDRAQDVPAREAAAMVAILMTQACLRAMIPAYCRKVTLVMRTTAGDPEPLMELQQLGNAVLSSERNLTSAERAFLWSKTIYCEELLAKLGFKSLSEQVGELRLIFVTERSEADGATAR